MRFAFPPSLTTPRRRIDTHVAQAILRLALAVLGALAILLTLALPLADALAECPCLAVVLAYVPAAALFLAWSLALARRTDTGMDSSLRLRLGAALVADVFVVGSFTALGGSFAPLALPLFLAVIIGYGWRYGSGWAFAASGLGALAFTAARPLNSLFEPGSIATLGYYLCLLATPVYVAQVLLAPVHASHRFPMPPAPPAGASSRPDRSTATSPPLVDEALCRELRESCAEPGLWQALVRQFEEEARSLLVQAGTAHDARDSERCAMALHRLRGAAASIAAPRLEQAIGDLEADPDHAPRWHSAREILDATVAALRGVAS